MTRKEFLSRATIYQVYPASFCDSNNDGWGDIQGIISKLDYIQSLGVRAIWLSPIYPSPMEDMGYDISDYMNVDPRFGTLDDFDQLVRECDRRGLKLIMDLVVNHTSDQHPWFREAIRDPSSKYRDYYIFRSGKGRNGRKAPNNWTSVLQTSAWTRLDDGSYYLHLYGVHQPDLNWRNPAVLEEVEKIMSFWMDRGVYGFRCDVISELYKSSFEDGKHRKLSEIALPVGHEHFVAQEGTHRILRKVRNDVIDPRGGVLIGECYGVNREQAQEFLNGELDAVISFDLVQSPGTVIWRKDPHRKFEKTLKTWQTQVSCNANYLENHDQHRSIGKFIHPRDDWETGAKMLLTLLFSLKGTILIYQGQELGAMDYPEFKPEDSRDMVARNMYSFFKKLVPIRSIAWKFARNVGRDDPRAPMAFNGDKGFGFTGPDVKPWMKFNPRSEKINVETEEKAESSVLKYFRRLTELRYNFDPLSSGDIVFLEGLPDGMIGIVRLGETESSLTLVNMTGKALQIPDKVREMKLELVISNAESKFDFLAPYEADIYRISSCK